MDKSQITALLKQANMEQADVRTDIKAALYIACCINKIDLNNYYGVSSLGFLLGTIGYKGDLSLYTFTDFKTILDELVNLGLVNQICENVYIVNNSDKELKAVLGFYSDENESYFFVEDSKTKVYKVDTLKFNVIPGDEVSVSIDGDRGIVKSVNAIRQYVLGRIIILDNTYKLMVDEHELQSYSFEFENKAALGEAKAGNVIIAKIVKRNHFSITVKTESIVKSLGNLDKYIMQSVVANDIPSSWPTTMKKALETIPSTVSEAEGKDRVDLRSLPLVTIDGEDARDFDDAVYATRQGDNWCLYVAIADVSYYVRPNTILDKEAINRCNSVYFPNFVIPMLPEALSNGICSLNPNVDRLCMVCQMEIDKEGEILKYKFYPAIMRSHARLTYTEAYKMINEGSVIYEEHKNYINDIKELHNLYKALHKARNRRGAVNAESDEVYFIFNEKLDIVGIDPVVRNDAHMLIEECMIAANICAATYVLEHKNVQTLYRVHAKPPVNKLNQLVASLRSLNLSIRMGTEPSSKDFAKFLKDNANRADSKFLQELILRAMAKAQYSKDNIGHFGLALKNYAHFTSPIRRYADLQLHRVIKYLLKKDKSMSLSKIGERSYSAEELVLLGDKCTKREIAAAEAEYEVVNKLKCKFVKNYEGCITEGTISAIHPFGIFVYLDKFYISGLVHISALSEDRYVKYDDFNNTLSFNGKVYKIGNKIKVTIAAVDIDEQTITLIPVSNKHSKKLANKVIDDTLDTLTKTEAKTKASSISEKLHQSSISEVFDKINKHKKTNAKEAIDLAKQHDSSFINLIKGNN